MSEAGETFREFEKNLEEFMKSVKEPISQEKLDEAVKKFKEGRKDKKTNAPPPETAKHFDDGKPRVDLLPRRPLLEVARIFEFGSKKYGEWNWQKGMEFRKVYASAIRHLLAWSDGEDLDPESNLPHLAHAATNILFLLEYTSRPALAHLDNRLVAPDPVDSQGDLQLPSAGSKQDLPRP